MDQATLSIDLTTPDGLTEFTCFERTDSDLEAIVARAQDADIIITNKVPITADVMQALPKLKLIQICATGMNNVDCDYAQKHGITVKNVADYSNTSVPEHTFMLILGAMRAGHYYHNKVADGSWQADGKFCLVDEPIFDLHGKTLGIIGAGSLGRAVGDIARAFGMQVLYAERQGKAPRDSTYTAFDTVLQTADILSIHCALTDDTYHLINDDTLAIIKQGGNKPLIVNMARGACVDTNAIANALQEDTILGFASDVFEQEPPSDDEAMLKFTSHPRVFLTPHNAWASQNAQRLLWDKLSAQVSAFIADNQ